MWRRRRRESSKKRSKNLVKESETLRRRCIKTVTKVGAPFLPARLRFSSMKELVHFSNLSLYFFIISHTFYSLFLSNYWLPKTRISVSHSLSLTVDDDCSLFGPWLPVSRLDHYFHWNSWLSSPLADPSFLKKWESERTFTLAKQKVSLSNGIVKLYSRFTNSLTYFPASRSSWVLLQTRGRPKTLLLNRLEYPEWCSIIV